MRLAGPCALIQVNPASRRQRNRENCARSPPACEPISAGQLIQGSDGYRMTHQMFIGVWLQASTQRCAAAGPLPQGTAHARRSPGPALRQAGGDRRGSVRPVVQPWCDSRSEGAGQHADQKAMGRGLASDGWDVPDRGRARRRVGAASLDERFFRDLRCPSLGCVPAGPRLPAELRPAIHRNSKSGAVS
jgi:hypothetical protein